MIDTILILDDDENDASLAVLALEKSGLRNQVAWLESCEDGIMYLRGVGANLPMLILLDLDFKERMDGLTFLTKIRAKPAWKRIPVIVLTADKDSMPDTYGMGALAHLVKPVDAAKLITAVQPLSIGWRLVLETE